jgi:hypothetical protein
MLAFENELTKQIEKVTVENGFDAKALLFHLTYLETVLLSIRSLTKMKIFVYNS